MTTGRVLNVQSIASDWLDSIIAHFTTAGVELPPRRGILPGEPRGVAWDCEQLIVTLVGIGFGQALDASSPSPQAGGNASVMAIRHAVLDCTLVRCTPNMTRKGSPPTIDVLNAAGLAYMKDAGLLSQASVEFCTRLKAGLPPEGKVQPGAVDPVGPNGGFHALSTTLAVTASRLE